MDQTLFTSIVTISLALLAGFITLLQVKSNIISASRVKWVEDLRNILSLYCSELENCSKLKLDFVDEIKKQSAGKDQYIEEKHYTVYANSANEVFKLQSKTFLYLNSDNISHKEILDLLRINSVLLHKEYEDHRHAIQANIEKIIFLAQKLFEAEMTKAKKLFNI